MSDRKQDIDVGDPTQVKQQKKAHELWRQKELEWGRAVLETYSGRAFVWRLLEISGVNGAIPTHPQDSFRGLGRRDVGLMIIEEVFTISPKYEIMMRDEAMARELERPKRERGT